MTNTNLTEEQQKFLEECENEFKDRYTEKDSDFMKVKNTELKKPPIIDPWHPKQRRSCDWPKQNYGKRHHSWDRHYERPRKKMST